MISKHIFVNLTVTVLRWGLVFNKYTCLLFSLQHHVHIVTSFLSMNSYYWVSATSLSIIMPAGDYWPCICCFLKYFINVSINLDIMCALCVVSSKRKKYFYRHHSSLPSPPLYWLLSISVLPRDRQYWPISVGKCWYFTFLTHINAEPLPQSSSQTAAAAQAWTQKAAATEIS